MRIHKLAAAFAAAINLLCITGIPQTDNVRVGVGLNGTVTAGFDRNFGKTLIEGEGGVSRICKTPGGCGPQFDLRGVVARKVRPNISIQGGVVYSRYNVDLFDKSALQLLGGVRYTTARVVAELNYRHDLTSENKLRIGEFRITGYLPKHVFLRTGYTFSSATQFNSPYKTGGPTLSAGVYF